MIAGKARVVDGDTLVINGNDRIRLYGVDAPESKQICKCVHTSTTDKLDASAVFSARSQPPRAAAREFFHARSPVVLLRSAPCSFTTTPHHLLQTQFQ